MDLYLKNFLDIKPAVFSNFNHKAPKLSTQFSRDIAERRPPLQFIFLVNPVIIIHLTIHLSIKPTLLLYACLSDLKHIVMLARQDSNTSPSDMQHKIRHKHYLNHITHRQSMPLSLPASIKLSQQPLDVRADFTAVSRVYARLMR